MNINLKSIPVYGKQTKEHMNNSFVAGVVLLRLRPRECHFGGALQKETLSRCAPSVFLYSRAYKQA